MDKVFTKTYKGAEIEIVVEDGLITTAKIYVGYVCKEVVDVTAEGYPNGVPYDEDYINQLEEQFKSYIDEMLVAWAN